MVLHALGFEDILRKFIFIYFSTFPGKGSNMSFVNEKTEMSRTVNWGHARGDTKCRQLFRKDFLEWSKVGS